MIILASPICAKCGRPLKNASDSGYGPKCERSVLGRATRRRKARVTREIDPRQVDWVQEVRV